MGFATSVTAADSPSGVWVTARVALATVIAFWNVTRIVAPSTSSNVDPSVTSFASVAAAVEQVPAFPRPLLEAVRTISNTSSTLVGFFFTFSVMVVYRLYVNSFIAAWHSDTEAKSAPASCFVANRAEASFHSSRLTSVRFSVRVCFGVGILFSFAIPFMIFDGLGK